MSDVDRRVEALPQVHDDVRLEDRVVAGEAVDLDHGAAGAVGGVVKPPTTVGLGVVVEACLDMLNFNFHIFQEICQPASAQCSYKVQLMDNLTQLWSNHNPGVA